MCRRVAHSTGVRFVVRAHHAVGGVAVELGANHLQREVVVLLLTQDESQAFDFGVAELAIPRRCSLWLDETLTFEEPDLGDGDVGKLFEQKTENFPDRKIRLGAHDALSKKTMR